MIYEKIKKIISSAFPKRVIIKCESIFRFFHFQFYRGNRFKCNVCDKKLRKFIELKSGDKLCPFCGSSSRNRRLWNILKSEYLRSNIRVLHFSPSRSLKRFLSKDPSLNYITSDFMGEFEADKHYNITNINESDNSFDLIICYHILEHIEDDRAGMNELYRVLKPGGSCIIQTPFKDGEIYEDATIKTAEDRLKYFGQKDHLRIYSVDGLKDRLTDSGFNVNINEFKEEEDNFNCFNSIEYVLIGTK
ncbi:MAG: methyltransferase domain-containing protein [Ignavibacteriaceae bacterium]|nr:methyltransferase domain-containing protein [Ignavibacteriaceae bacterium]